MEFKEKRPLYQLEEIISILRGENGCAWDRKQTPRSLLPYLVEETYEMYDAVESGDKDHMKEEMGDLLLQIYLHAEIARENNQFTMDDVARSIIDKIIRRHPHVFGDDTVTDADEVIHRWEKIKRKEKSGLGSILDGVPRHLPALLKAYRVQQKVSRIGFDWERVEDAAAKLGEELDELTRAIGSSDGEKILEEAGDILFSITNVLRFMRVNPEEALQKAVGKFSARFRHIERRARETDRNLEEMKIDEMEALWEEAKKRP